ncbi:MAG TPA: hypothetical protein PKD76_11220 [Solirubrobacterales bacterium]|nr:hypothetical protein [Solirubrobacterales bacterium]
MGLIDIHCHLLPGIDDGPGTIEGSIAMSKVYLTAGITRVAATPHVNLRHENTAEKISTKREELEARLEAEGLSLEIAQGAEVSADVINGLDDNELRDLSLGGGNWLLLEPPTQASAFSIHQSVFDVQRRGFRVVLAHPERNPALQDDLDLVADLVAGGVRTQVTAESLTGRYGPAAEKTARRLLKRELVHTIASDAHHATERPPGMAGELKRSGHKDLIQYLCHDMPAWILDGGPEPRRPEVDKKKAGRGILGRLGFSS